MYRNVHTFHYYMHICRKKLGALLTLQTSQKLAHMFTDLSLFTDYDSNIVKSQIAESTNTIDF